MSSSTLQFPDAATLQELAAAGRLDDALQMFANILAATHSAPWVPAFCRDWLQCEDARVIAHRALRTAVFEAVFTTRVLVNAPVETYWEVAVRFGPTNQTTTASYLDGAPRSVPLKLGKLLLAKAEFGARPLMPDQFQQVVAVLFAAPAVAAGVITADWRREIARTRTREADMLAKMADAYVLGGPVSSLVTLFPQLSADRAHMLLVRTGESVEQLTQHMLDVPGFSKRVLAGASADAEAPTEYVVLDGKEKQRRTETLRKQRQREFASTYTALEEEDPDPEAEDAGIQPELSEADKKLIAQEQLLWSYWHSSRAMFDKQSRKSEQRRVLKAKLRWTDEQIEGWGRVSARSHPTGAQAYNVPKHLKEVESYAPALRPTAELEHTLDDDPELHQGQEPKRDQKRDQRRDQKRGHTQKRGGDSQQSTEPQKQPKQGNHSDKAKRSEKDKPPGKAKPLVKAKHSAHQGDTTTAADGRSKKKHNKQPAHARPVNGVPPSQQDQ